MSDPPNGAGLLRAEAALALVTVATAAGMARLFTDGAFLGRIFVVIAAAHLVNGAARRLRWPGVAAVAVVLMCGGAVISWLYLRSTLSFGVPTGRTLDLIRTDLREAFGPFDTLIAPVSMTPGFELTLATAAWILASFADAAAFRGDAPVQAVVPCGAAFLFSAILANGRGEVGATAVMLLALGCWAAAWHAWSSERHRWVEDTPHQGSRDLLRRALGIIAVATLVAVIAGPHLPADRSTALVDLRRLGQGSPNRVADNPLVGVGSLLRDQSNEPLFEVTAPAGHYWRLTSLEEFDAARQVWFSNQNFADADTGDLPLAVGEARRPNGVRQRAEFKITGLRGIWLPAAYAPRTLDVTDDVRYSTESASLIAASGEIAAGTRYTVESALPAVERAPGTFTPPVDRGLLTVPSPLRIPLARLARDIVSRAGATGDAVAGARALQDWFRSNFVYDASANYSGAADPTSEFLSARIGFCQQFSSTFALMARSIGLPARVAVGFTYGTPVAQADDGDVTFVIRGRQAHAWPEVLIPGTGWLAFEPTPTRGNPDATAWTGVQAAQDEGTGDAVPTTTSATTTSPGATSSTAAPTTTTPDRATGAETASDTAGASGRSWWATTGWVLLLLAIGVVTVIGLRLVWLRWARGRRRRHAVTPSEQVAVAWAEVNEALRSTVPARAPTETIDEFARRVGTVVEIDGLDRLATLEAARVYSNDRIDETDAAAAMVVADRVETTVTGSLDVRGRIRHELRSRRA